MIRRLAARTFLAGWVVAVLLLHAPAATAGEPDTPALRSGRTGARIAAGPRHGASAAGRQEFGLLYADRYFYIDNAGLRRVYAVINGNPFKLTTDPGEVLRGANTLLISDTGETTIDMGRYMIPAPETDTTLNRMSVEAEGPPGSDAFIVIADQYITDTIHYVLDLSAVPASAALTQNYPNPFNGPTTIRYDIPVSLVYGVDVRLVVYDLLGREVKVLVEDRRYPGSFTVRWDGNDTRGEPAASGAYFYRITAGDILETRRLLLIR